MIVDILLTYLQPIKLRIVVDMFEQYKYISTHVDSFPPKHLISLPIVVVHSFSSGARRPPLALAPVSSSSLMSTPSATLPRLMFTINY
jgi:hypothetical protein